MSGISTHVLDVARGRPAAGIEVRLEARAGEAWTGVGRAATDGDGRVRALVGPGERLQAGVYRLRFELASYFARLGIEAFFPEATIVFQVREPGEAHHVPLLLSPFGYSTYRGS